MKQTKLSLIVNILVIIFCLLAFLVPVFRQNEKVAEIEYQQQ